MLGYLFRLVIAPRSKHKDRSRREFILNILLGVLIILSTTAFCINVVELFAFHRKVSESPITAGIILGIFIFLLFLSRKGKSQTSALILVSLLFIVCIYLNYTWGADLPVVLLFYALIIVMAGILIGTRFAFLVTIFCAASILFFSQLEIVGIIHPNRVRKLELIRMADSLVHVIILGIIAVVSWLFNRESEKALKRARTSEAALRRQRDQLEEMVENRTKQLKQAQIEKITQLYRFAEFGRSASGLFHDLVTPLNLTSLNLHRLQKQIRLPELSDAKVALDRAIIGTKRLESFIIAARKQIQDQKVLQKFSVKDEVDQSIQIIGHKAKEKHVVIELEIKEDIKTFGNPFKFNQIITNLLSNSIDSYDKVRRKKKTIKIVAAKIHDSATFSVQDWGCGISKKNLSKIFDPLFTTKNMKGMGIGLSICKELVEKDFKGKIFVESRKNIGTTFRVIFPIEKAPSGKIKIQIS